MAYNGAAIIAMAGKDCVAIARYDDKHHPRVAILSCMASDTRMGVQGQTISTDFQKVFRLNDKTFLGLSGLATDVQSVSQLLRFKLNMYKMQEEREIKAKTLSAMISNMMYEKRYVHTSVPWQLQRYPQVWPVVCRAHRRRLDGREQAVPVEHGLPGL